MRQAAMGLSIVLCMAVLATPALADGTLQWGTCSSPVAYITDANQGGELVPVGNLVELWDENGAAPVAVALVGQGYITSQPGRVVSNTSLPDGSYSMQMRVYNVADPYSPGVESCLVIVGAEGRGSAGINLQISTLLPATICFPAAEIPIGAFDPDLGGGCQVMNPLSVSLASFDVVATPD
jgi:hypothetical protein